MFPYRSDIARKRPIPILQPAGANDIQPHPASAALSKTPQRTRLHREYSSLGGGKVVRFPRIWMVYGECRIKIISYGTTPYLFPHICLRTDETLQTLVGWPALATREPIIVIRRGKLTPRIRGSQRTSAPISVKHAPRITNDSCRHGQARVQWPCYR